MSAPRKIVTHHIFPPIPIRTHDWCAYYEGEEERGGYGYGRTEAEAIHDFLDNHGFEDESETIIKRCVFPHCSCEMHCDTIPGERP